MVKAVRRFVFLVALLCAAHPAALLAADPQPQADVPPLMEGLAKRLLPAVVNISSTQAEKISPDKTPDIPNFPPNSPFYQFFKDFNDQQNDAQNDKPDSPQERGTSLGSGFIIDASGIVLTNNHVIDGADKITVIMQDNTTYSAKLVGRDALTDLAVLKITPHQKLAVVRLGDSDAMRAGDWVMAIGNPYGLGGTITAGIISAKNRAINDGGPYDDFLQTDAAINKGNSGGPLFNLKGQVIGINSAIFSPSGGSIGIGFAIPSATVQHVTDDLRHYGHLRHGWLGARVMAVNSDIAAALDLSHAQGTLVGATVAGSPAEKAGVKPGDIIVDVNNAPVSSLRVFRRLISDVPPGGAISLAVWRGGKLTTLSAKAADEAIADPQTPDNSSDAAPAAVLPDKTSSLLGLVLSAPTAALRNQYQLPDGPGVIVLDARKSAPTTGGTLQPGDAIIEISGSEARKPHDLARRITELRKTGRKSALLLVNRNGDLRYVTIRIDIG